MKILHTVQFYSPQVGGSEEVVRQLSERLAKRGHDVTVVTFFDKRRTQKNINGVKVIEFKISGNSVFGITGEKEKYQNFLKKEKFDVMMNYGTEIWSTDVVLPLLDEISAKKVLVPLGFQGLHKAQCKNYYQKMPTYLKKYDKAIYLSEHYRDKDFADKHELKNSIIIANGADEKEFLAEPKIDFRKKYGIKTPYLLLNVSNHYPNKGHEFLMDTMKKLNRDDITLAIIGGKPANFWYFFYYTCYYKCQIKKFFYKNVRMLNKISREDTLAAFKAADLFVFGSQFECSPLVIFEAMASKLPFISTDCGNVKDFAEYGSIIKTPDAMAEKINEWLEDPGKRKKIGEAAFQNWQKKYTWDRITDEYETLYKSLLSKKHTKN